MWTVLEKFWSYYKNNNINSTNAPVNAPGSQQNNMPGNPHNAPINQMPNAAPPQNQNIVINVNNGQIPLSQLIANLNNAIIINELYRGKYLLYNFL